MLGVLFCCNNNLPLPQIYRHDVTFRPQEVVGLTQPPNRRFLSIRGKGSTIFGHDLALSSNQAVTAREFVNERKLAVDSICTFRIDQKGPHEYGHRGHRYG